MRNYEAMSILPEKQKAKLEANRRPHHGRINTQRLNLSLKYISGSILDIGCAQGEYVKEYRQRGHHAEGVDALDYSIEWNKNGIEKYCKIIDIESMVGQKYDTVTCFEVLEHVPEPSAFIEHLISITNKIILITVPICPAPKYLEISGLSFNHYTDNSHVNFFSKIEIISLLGQFDLRVIHYEEFNRINTVIPLLCEIGLPLKISRILGKLYRILPRKTFQTQFIACEKI